MEKTKEAIKRLEVKYGDFCVCEICGLDIPTKDMMNLIEYCTVCSLIVHTDCNKSHPVINTDTYTCFSE